MNKRESRTIQREDLKRIVERLAAKRQKLGMSQRELSRRMSMWEMAVHEIESGERGLQVTELIDTAQILEEDPVTVLAEAITDDGNSIS